MQQVCEQIVGSTAETITITGLVNFLRIGSGIADKVYLKFNWSVGDTEVSSTNFDVVLNNYDALELIHRSPSFPKVRNVRVICATGGYVSLLAW